MEIGAQMLTLKWPGSHGALPKFIAYFTTIASNFSPVLFIIITLMDMFLLTQKFKSARRFLAD